MVELAELLEIMALALQNDNWYFKIFWYWKLKRLSRIEQFQNEWIGAFASGFKQLDLRLE